MADDKSLVDYAPVIADLEAKRDRLNATIAMLRDAAGMGPAPEGSGGGGSGGAPTPTKEADIPSDAFFGMKIPDAAAKYLGIAKKPRSTAEIKAALERGGFVHSSSNFFNTVYTALDRENSRGGEIIKVNKQWGLAKWYPNRPRKKVKGQEAEEDATTTEAPTPVEQAS